MREHVSQCAPESERPVTDREHRSRESSVAQAAEHLGPGVGRLPVAVGQRHQLFRAVGTHPDDHERAEPVLVQADVEVDPVGPEVDVVETREIAAGPLGVLGLPGLGEPVDRRGGQSGLGAEELAQGGREVPGREPPQVEDRQHLGDLGGLAHVGRQDGRGEPLALPTVVDPGGLDLDDACAGRDLPFPGVTVAHNQAFSGGVELCGVGLEVGPPFGQQRRGQHLLGGHPADLVEADGSCFVLTHRVRGGVMD